MSKYNLENLSIREKIGQLLMVGFQEKEISEDIINLIRDYKIGNIILFERNFDNPEQLFKLTQDLQKVALESIGIPLFISMDQEGGMVTKITSGSTIFPSAMSIAASNNYENASLMGEIMGKELKAYGVNMNLAPIFDVNNNPSNPIIGSRSFSDKPEEVAKYATNFALGLQKSGVYAVGKHFPGHGDTHVDSHIGLPTINHERELLDQVELYPFKYGSDNGVKGFMTTHIVFTTLEKELPATMSHKILTGVLRNDIGFNGLIVSDGMEMRGITNHYDIKYATMEAIKAGVDLALLCHPNQSHRRRTIDYIIEEYNNGNISDEIINNRVSRVLKEKETFAPINLKKDFNEIKDVVINSEHKKASYNVVKDAFSLIKGENIKLSENALFIGHKSLALTIASGSDGFVNAADELKKEFTKLDTVTIEANPNAEEINMIISKLNKYDQIILTTYNSNRHPNQIELINKVNELHNNVYVVSMRDPFDLFHTKGIKNYLALYEYTTNSVNVLVDYLKGNIVPTGTPPVKYE